VVTRDPPLGANLTAATARTVVPLAPAVAAVVYLVVLLSGARLLNDPDSYWHVAVGRWIVAHGAVPTADPFSFTFAGHPWIAKEWLSQLLYSGAYALAGWGGMVILAAAATALAFGLLAQRLERSLAPTAAIALVAGAFVLVAPHLTARPHVLALPVMVAWTAGLVAAADGRRAPSFLLLPLMVLWANLHGGFTLGLVLVVAAGLDTVWSAAAADRTRLALAWLRFLVLAAVAACVTPYGPESMLVTGRILGMGDALRIIGEWRPQDFGHVGIFEILLLLGLGLALHRGMTLPPFRLLTLLGLLHLALSAERNAELIGLLAPLFLAMPLAAQFPAFRRADAGSGRGRPLLGAAIVALLLPVTAGLAAMTAPAPPAAITPAGALEALRKAKAGPILNAYDFGGYLIANDVPTFIDGRTELYGADFVERYQNAVMLTDPLGLETLLAEHRIGATLLQTGMPATAWLDRMPGWKRLYADDVAVVHVKTGP
jgi:hypothetical protein